MLMFKQSQSSILASTGHSIGKPTCLFLGKPEQNLNYCWQVFVLATACSEEVAINFMARFHVVVCLFGGSSCRVADFEFRGEGQRLYSCFFSGQDVDSTQACQKSSRSPSGSRHQRVGLACLVAMLSAVLAGRNRHVGLPMLCPVLARMLL